MKRTLYITFGLFLVVAWFIAVVREESEKPSSFSARPSGTKAALKLIDILGIDVERYFHPFTRLKGVNQLLLVVAPGTVGYEQELFAWMRKGNHVLFFDGPTVPRAKLLKLAGAQEFNEIGLGTLAPPQEDNCPASVLDKLISELPHSRSTAPRDAQILLGSIDNPQIYTVPLGEGSLTYISSDRLIRNEFIDRCDNALLLLQLVEGKDLVRFDEFHHGYTAPLSIERKERLTALYWISGLIAFATGAAALSRARRFGPPISQQEDYVAHTAEAIKALGVMYSDHNSRAALSSYTESCRSRISRQSGKSMLTDDQELFRTLDQSGVFGQISREKFETAWKAIDKANSADIQTIERAIAVYADRRT